MQSAKRPSWIPVIAGVVAILLSVTIYLVPTIKNSGLIYLAYIFTPFTPILMMAIAQTKHAASCSNMYYDLASGNKITKLTRALSVVGFLVAIPIIIVIAKNFSEI